MPDSSSILVFTPAPQLTVTIERRNDADEVHLHAGGQGYWIARLVVALGAPAVLAGSFGGETGPLIRTLVASAGIGLRALDVAVDNGAYVHDRRDGARRVLATQAATPLGRHHVDELYSITLAAGLDASVCVLGGSNRAEPLVVPDDTYRRLAADLTSAGRPVIADLSGGARAAAATGGATLIKTSEEDLMADGALRREATASDLAAVMEDIRGRASHVIVTRADAPAIIWSQGTLWRAYGPRFEVLDHRGAGDSMTAGIAVALHEGTSVLEGLRLGVAAAALNVTRRGLGSGTNEAIRSAAAHVTVERA